MGLVLPDRAPSAAIAMCARFLAGDRSSDFCRWLIVTICNRLMDAATQLIVFSEKCEIGWWTPPGDAFAWLVAGKLVLPHNHLICNRILLEVAL